MSGHALQTDRAGSGVVRRAVAWAAAAALVAALAGGCGAKQSSAPSSSSMASPAAATPAPTPSPTPAHSDTLRVGWTVNRGFRDQWGIQFPSQVYPAAFVYSGLYRFDEAFKAIPDLADGPCFVPGADAMILRCRLVDTTFHDGTSLTADDVAYSYRLWAQDPFEADLGSLKEVRVIDPRTIDFLLSSVDPTFETMVLTNYIFPEHAVEAAYADFVAGTRDLEAKDLAALGETIDTEASGDPPVCPVSRVDEVEGILAKIGVHLYREDYQQASGAFDACTYLEAASASIGGAADALGKTGLDAVAAVLVLRSIDERPVGAGPYRFVTEDADRIHLEAWPGYHGGLAATRYLDFVRTNGDGSAVADGTVDILQEAPSDVTYQATAAAHGIQFATVLSTGLYYALAFNVRPGRLFADVNLRKALQLCVDLPRDVDAATSGRGTPVYGPIPPGNWANDPDLPRPPRDTAAARALIEGAGWQLGADGVYAKDGVRLAAQIVVRPDYGDRTTMADLVALQARDCGMDLQSRLVEFGDIWGTLLQYPNNIPGTKTPFDLYIGGWGHIFDPGSLSQFTSSTITDAKHPDSDNFIGFSDPLVDRLAAEAMATYDQAERTRDYRQIQEEIQAQQPYLFLWSDTFRDAVRSAVTTLDGPLDLTGPNWARAQLSRMVVTANP
jgi:ABC-type transport system substrate-binding protein